MEQSSTIDLVQENGALNDLHGFKNYIDQVLEYTNENYQYDRNVFKETQDYSKQILKAIFEAVNICSGEVVKSLQTQNATVDKMEKDLQRLKNRMSYMNFKTGCSHPLLSEEEKENDMGAENDKPQMERLQGLPFQKMEREKFDHKINFTGVEIQGISSVLGVQQHHQQPEILQHEQHYYEGASEECEPLYNYQEEMHEDSGVDGDYYDEEEEDLEEDEDDEEEEEEEEEKEFGV